MNRKAEQFKSYLETHAVTCFQIDEIAGDKMNMVVFRSHMDVCSAHLQTLVLCDSTMYTVIRVLVLAGALTKENENALRKQIDMLNGKYRILKFYLSPEGDLVLDVVVPEQAGTIDGDMVMTMLDVIIRNLETEYKSIAGTVLQ